jgi:hypothetical protein
MMGGWFRAVKPRRRVSAFVARVCGLTLTRWRRGCCPCGRTVRIRKSSKPCLQLFLSSTVPLRANGCARRREFWMHHAMKVPENLAQRQTAPMSTHYCPKTTFILRWLSIGGAFSTIRNPVTSTLFDILTFRSALFWNVAQCVMVIFYRRFGTTYRSHLQGSRRTNRIGYWRNTAPWLRAQFGAL